MTKANAVLTLKKLIEKGACAAALKAFKRQFGDEIEVTVELAVSVADVFDWNWAAIHLLTPANCADFVCATNAYRAEYNRATEEARAEYKCAMAGEWALAWLAGGVK